MDIEESLRPAVVAILNDRGDVNGTGFFVTSDGFILTCYHVIEDYLSANKVRIRTEEHEEFDAFFEVDKSCKEKDIDFAVLKVESQAPFQCLRLGTNFKKEDRWCTLGHNFPDNYKCDPGGGTIFSKALRTRSKGNDIRLKTELPIRGGMSGAPLLIERSGVVAGVIKSRPTEEGSWEAFVVPIADVFDRWPDLEKLNTDSTLIKISHSPANMIGVPDLPPNFLPRPRDLQAIKDSVLSKDKKTNGIISARSRIGVQGMGGVGKSVMAAAVARDEDVQRAFSDGIIWITLGLNPNLELRQSDLVEALSDKPRVFDDVQQGRSRLSKLLGAKSCLIILDDVWKTEHAQVFDALGTNCKMMITTRNSDIVTALGTSENRLDILEDNQALKLLADWAAIDLVNLPAEAQDVARECGNLPLALAMIGAMVRDKPDRWVHALHRLQNADLEKIRLQFPNYPYPDLLKVLQVSVEALEPDAQTRYLDFAVFPEDTLIPEAVLQTFWEPQGLDQYDAQDLMDSLVAHSLVRRDKDGNLSLHHLQFDYVKKQAGDLKALHNRLLSSYCDKYLNIGSSIHSWADGPNDGYFFQHLAYHLIEAGRKDELRSLLLDFEWIKSKLEATDILALILDYDSLPENLDTCLVRDALRLSAHVLDGDKSQLSGQLQGRLMALPFPQIQAIVEQIVQKSDGIRIFSLTPSLTPPGGPLLRTLNGRYSSVGLAVTPDCRKAVSVSKDSTLVVWDLETGQDLMTLKGHSDSVLAVALTPDGRKAVSASKDKTLKVWDLETGIELRTLKGHKYSVIAVAVTADGQKVVSVSGDNHFMVWDIEKGQMLTWLRGNDYWTDAVAVTPDGRKIVSISYEWRISYLELWDLEKGQMLREFEVFSWAKLVAVTPDGRKAVLHSDGNHLVVWDIEKGQKLGALVGHYSRINAVAVTPDGKKVISALDDGTINVWELEKLQKLCTFRGHSYAVTAIAVAVTPNGQKVISASDDRTIKVWDLEKLQKFCTFRGHFSFVAAVAITSDGRKAVSASCSNDHLELRVWDLKTCQEVLRKRGHYSYRLVAVTTNGRKYLNGWDLKGLKELRRLEDYLFSYVELAGEVSTQLTLGVRNEILASYKGFTLWDLEEDQRLCSMIGCSSSDIAVAVTADGRKAVYACDNILTLWDLETGQKLRTMADHSSVTTVAITPDGKKAVYACDNILTLWDLETGQKLRTMADHSSITAVAITPDGRKAVSACDNYLTVWNLETGELIVTFTGENPIHCCAVGSDGITIVAGESSGRMHFLRLEGAHV